MIPITKSCPSSYYADMVEEICNARNTLAKLRDQLKRLTPNARDYADQPSAAAAQAESYATLDRLVMIDNDLLARALDADLHS